MNTLNEIKEQKMYWKPVRTKRGEISYIVGPIGKTCYPASFYKGDRKNETLLQDPQGISFQGSDGRTYIDDSVLNEIFPKQPRVNFETFEKAVVVTIGVLALASFLYIARYVTITSPKRIEAALNNYAGVETVLIRDYGSYPELVKNRYPSSVSIDYALDHLKKLNGGELPEVTDTGSVVVPKYEKLKK